MRNRNEYRDEPLNREVRRWKIVAFILGLMVVYGLVGRMDSAAQAEQKPGVMQPQAWRAWV